MTGEDWRYKFNKIFFQMRNLTYYDDIADMTKESLCDLFIRNDDELQLIDLDVANQCSPELFTFVPTIQQYVESVFDEVFPI